MGGRRRATTPHEARRDSSDYDDREHFGDYKKRKQRKGLLEDLLDF